jgi:hypothetical protein
MAFFLKNALQNAHKYEATETVLKTIVTQRNTYNEFFYLHATKGNKT